MLSEAVGRRCIISIRLRPLPKFILTEPRMKHAVLSNDCVNSLR